jgi:hypothetical protein
MNYRKTASLVALATSLFMVFTLSSNSKAAEMASPKPTIKLPPVLTPKLIWPKDAVVDGVVFNSKITKKIDIWEDFQCSNCAKFDRTNGALLNKVIATKLAQVDFHTLTFLGAESEDLANATACASDANKFLELRSLLFAQQPATKNSGFWSSGQILKTASQVGLSSSTFQNCVNSHKYLAWVRSLNSLATKERIAATPTVLINRVPINRSSDYLDSNRLEKVIRTPSLIVPTPTSSDVSPSSGGFNVSKVFGVEPTFNKPTGAPPTSPGAGEIIVGTGEPVQKSDTITVQYVLMNWATGSIVESSCSKCSFMSGCCTTHVL